MIRSVQWFYDDATNTLRAEVQRQGGTGSDVVWSTADTTPPSPWIETPFDTTDE